MGLTFRKCVMVIVTWLLIMLCLKEKLHIPGLETHLFSQTRGENEKQDISGHGSSSWHSAPTQLDLCLAELPTSCCPQCPFSAWQGVTVSYHIQQWPHPPPLSANRSTTGETGEPMMEELAIWSTQLTQSAVSQNQHTFSSLSLLEFSPIKRQIIGCVWMSHIWHDLCSEMSNGYYKMILQTGHIDNVRMQTLVCYRNRQFIKF